MTIDAEKNVMSEPKLGPPCPITGLPPKRHIHGMSKSLIQDLWRIGQGVDVASLFSAVSRFELYESPTGLVYFDPPIVGDSCFYDDYYRRWDVHRGLSYRSETRVDYARTASHVRAGASVIDVGCGPGVFRHHLPHAQYTGLDPYAAADVDAVVLREQLDDHAVSHEGCYDVATAFHVIEHIADPLRHARLMVRLLKPGGLLVLAAPLYPSPLTEIPNLPLNMPPHHVTWWNPAAFTALAKELDLDVVEAATLPPSLHQGQVYWVHRLLFRRTDGPPAERFFAHRWSWHASLLAAYWLSKLAHRMRPMPPGARPVDAYLVARKRA